MLRLCQTLAKVLGLPCKLGWPTWIMASGIWGSLLGDSRLDRLNKKL